MQSRVHLTTWVSREAKERFGRIAGNEGLSESALLRRIVETAVVADGPADSIAGSTSEPVVSSGRVSVRLRQDDLVLLRERATARDLPTSTYISYLVRAHLRAQTPLPAAELDALKRSVAEIGRNINQIARAVNQQQWPAGPSRHDLQQIIRVLAAMRDHIKSLINANLASWSSGHAKTDD